jgi:hypothetical protein
LGNYFTHREIIAMKKSSNRDMDPAGRPRYKAPSGKASVKGDMWADDGAAPHNGRMPKGQARFPKRGMMGK